MNIDWTMILIAVIPGAILAIPGIIALRGQYKKENADASSTNVDTALKLMEKLESQVDEMSDRIDVLENRENEYVLCLQKLIAQIEALGIVPVVTRQDVNKIARMEVRR